MWGKEIKSEEYSLKCVEKIPFSIVYYNNSIVFMGSLNLSFSVLLVPHIRALGLTQIKTKK